MFFTVLRRDYGFILMFKLMLIAGLGGFLGTCGRFLVGRATALWTSDLPLATFTVNAVGCFLTGLIFGLMEKGNVLSQAQSIFLVTGFCGGFTTFSAFSGELLAILDRGQWIHGAVYITASIISGVFLVWLGRSLLR